VIFKATSSGDAPTSSCQGGTPSTGTGTTLVGACNVYHASDMSRPVTDFGCSSTSPDRYWCPTVRQVAQSVATGGPPDYIGVWMQVTHHWVTRLFGSTKILTSSAILRLEPVKM